MLEISVDECVASEGSDPEMIPRAVDKKEPRVTKVALPTYSLPMIPFHKCAQFNQKLVLAASVIADQPVACGEQFNQEPSHCQ